MKFFYGLSLLGATLASAEHFTVQVGLGGDVYTPNQLQAKIGDIIQFNAGGVYSFCKIWFYRRDTTLLKRLSMDHALISAEVNTNEIND